MTRRLEELLDQVAAALVRGDLAGLATLAPLIEAGADSLPRDRASASRIQRKAERNARLLQAAGRGITSARTRFADIVQGPVLTTYDARGRREAVAALPTGPVKRF